MNSLLSIAPEVSAALAAGRPVVALESTIISHGMPYPQNLEMAQRVEGIIREEGAVPATIAVADGRIHVGLDEALLHRLATAKGVAKLSRRDLAGILASGGLGATTVAATMIAAHLAGIRVFATGGIGGVHRGAETSFDVSADLDELARTPVAVVCAGAKSILDLPKTLEYLETRGVPVIGYGTGTLPAFFSRSSGLALALRRDTPEEVAALLDAQAALGFPAGAVIANPIPEAHALPEAEIDAAITSALADAGREGVGGKDVTPYLLARIVALTGGRSLTANIALVEHNARLGARIAKALAARA
ncbi:pseudouridine-5'-phosphate glycosidase [Inquilinus ginsengisoli]|uniref:Pseudouridine-5'-phosphate glycosidase n=1 Tax=Inquilinus ginsengisoli TaxID=363840 RepID=A0ABU1JW54_9PROT|nr:pseudouridine-5'-phosphate glycosidase [Inquilinus ginsengisoli]MDR6292854.1 pseudouridine-5'-phosphate glycosidase [Inquilinus ginsengisoli]